MSGNPMNEDDQQLSLLKQDSAHHADRAPTEAARQQSESVVGAFGNRPRTRRRP
jgi:hypothetical protein